MTDNVTLPGSGSSVATDDVDGQHYQRIKLVSGGEGVADEINPSAETIFSAIEKADDNITTVTYVDSTRADLSTIVQSSTSVGATATETFDNSGATTLVITRGVV
jgi:hypothetical protein